MDPLRMNGYFFYAVLEELRVIKEFSRVKWRRHKEFGYNMLGLVFKNSVSKAVLDACPNPILKVNGLDEQLKTVKLEWTKSRQILRRSGPTWGCRP